MAGRVSFLVRTLEHPRRRRPVRPDGAAVARVRQEAEDVQAARLRRRAVPRRRRRAGHGAALAGRDRSGKAKDVKKMLDGEGLVAEFVAPRLWEDPRRHRRRLHRQRPASVAQWAIERAEAMRSTSPTPWAPS